MEETVKILLCEDDENLGMLLREYLLTKGFDTTLCPDGEAGFKEFSKNKFDIAVLDVMMPKKDGFTLAQEIRQQNVDMPIVFLTAKTLKEDILEGFKIGADDYITKPFDVDMLNLRVKNLLRLSNPSTIPDTQEMVEKEYTMSEGDKKFIASVDAYIQDNMSNPDTSVENMSAHLYISRVQLYKRMVSLTGTTPSEYLRAKRIKRAEELLRTGDFTISEIAYRVGFNNPRYFSKYFQETYGMPPSQYKKKIFK